MRTLIKQDFDQALEKVDALITPTVPYTAFKAGEKTGDPLQMYLSDIYTISCNLAGTCGISVPCGFTNDPKLPVGLQLLGKPFGEQELLKIAHAYEQSTPWHNEKGRALMEYETIIGLETHCQLKTQSKMFCACANEFGADPTRTFARSASACPACCRCRTNVHCNSRR